MSSKVGLAVAMLTVSLGVSAFYFHVLGPAIVKKSDEPKPV